MQARLIGSMLVIAALGAGATAAADRSPVKSARAADAAAAAERVTYGSSVAGRPLRALRVDGRGERRRLLVVGSLHGDEPEGERIVDRLRRRSGRLRAELWTIRAANPDGSRSGRRTNARGVDLNRNFPYRWRRAEPPGSGYYQGPRPASEPETRALMRLIRRIEPTLTVWLHQPWDAVLAPCRGGARPEKRYARIARMAVERCRGEELRGTATSWQEHRDRRATAFVVELRGGSLSGAEQRRHVRAVRALAGSGRR